MSRSSRAAQNYLAFVQFSSSAEAVSGRSFHPRSLETEQRTGARGAGEGPVDISGRPGHIAQDGLPRTDAL
jgi:hypothetical protein